MALETVNVVVDDTAFTAIGTNVTALTVTEVHSSYLRIYITATGGDAPVVGSEYQIFNGDYSFSGPAADIYVMSPDGATTVGVVRS